VPRTLRGRLALALGLTAALSLGAAAVLALGLVRRAAEDQARAELRRFAEASVAETSDDLALDPVRLRALRRVLAVSGNLLAVVGPLGGVAGGTPEARAVAEAVDRAPLLEGRSSEGTVLVGGRRYAYVAVPVAGAVARPGRPVAGLVLARRVGVPRGTWRPVAARVLLAAGVAAALAGLASTFLARRLARPVQQVAAASGRVAAGELDARVPVEGPEELAGLARSFNEMAAALAESRRREAEFLAAVSHELRTPITAIRGYLEALEEGAVRDEAGRAEALRVIRAETARLERLVRDVMDLARLDARQFRLAPRDADLAEVLRETARAHGGQARDAGVALETVVPEPLPCRTDPDRVRQVLTNLVENALRVTPPGGRVTLAGRHVPDGVVLEVSDTGPGIPPEHLPHVFERSWLRAARRAEEPAEPGRLAPGTGLGLAIVRELVVALGGRVEVSSDPGRGTTFRVALPAAGPGSSADAPS
jgi:two-component system OmpR family sensor kinase